MQESWYLSLLFGTSAKLSFLISYQTQMLGFAATSVESLSQKSSFGFILCLNYGKK